MAERLLEGAAASTKGKKKGKMPVPDAEGEKKTYLYRSRVIFHTRTLECRVSPESVKIDAGYSRGYGMS